MAISPPCSSQLILVVKHIIVLRLGFYVSSKATISSSIGSAAQCRAARVTIQSAGICTHHPSDLPKKKKRKGKAVVERMLLRDMLYVEDRYVHQERDCSTLLPWRGKCPRSKFRGHAQKKAYIIVDCTLDGRAWLS